MIPLRNKNNNGGQWISNVAHRFSSPESIPLLSETTEFRTNMDVVFIAHSLKELIQSNVNVWNN